MSRSEVLLTSRQRYLKWKALDWLETTLMILCGLTLAGFSLSVLCDVILRQSGHPANWIHEVTSHFFIYGVFIGAAVATRRNEHLLIASIADALHGLSRILLEVFTRAVVLAVALAMMWFGYLNFLEGLTSYRMPSMTPIGTLYAAIPISGAFIALFIIEQIANGLRNGFEHPESDG